MRKYLFLMIAISVLLMPSFAACALPQQSKIEDSELYGRWSPVIIPTSTLGVGSHLPRFFDKIIFKNFSSNHYGLENVTWSHLQNPLMSVADETLAILPEELLVLLEKESLLNLFVNFEYLPEPYWEKKYGDSPSNKINQRYFRSVALVPKVGPGSFVGMVGEYRGRSDNRNQPRIEIWVIVYSSKFFMDTRYEYIKRSFAVVFLHELAHALFPRLPDQIKVDYAIAGKYLIKFNENGETQLIAPRWKELKISILGVINQRPDPEELELYGIPTVYSAGGFEEDFAEALALYLSYPEYLKTTGETRYEFVDSWIRTKKAAR